MIVATLHPTNVATGAISGDSGRLAVNADVVAGPLLELLDVPNLLGVPPPGPVMFVAASSASAGWKSRPLEISFGGQEIASQTARRKSVLGVAAAALGEGSSELVDKQNAIEVQLEDQSQWLISCDQEGLAAGLNVGVIGDELIQFAQAAPLGGGKFKLTDLLRGRGGTEWACGRDVAGERFCLLDSGTLQQVDLPPWSIGATVDAASTTGATASRPFAGENVRPLSPVGLTAELQPSGDLVLGWTRRSRQGFAWVDGIDVPLGEGAERYAVQLIGNAGTVELTSGQPTLTVSSAPLAAVGTDVVEIEVRQVGDLAASGAAQTQINLA